MSQERSEGDTTHTQHGSGDGLDDLEQLADEVKRDPVALAAYEDAVCRELLVRALVAARADQELTQSEVAERMGTTQSVISALEKRRTDPRLSTLQRYARACGRVFVLTLREAATGLSPATLSAEITEGELQRPSSSSPSTGAFSESHDDVQELTEEVRDDPVAVAAYTDAVRRGALVASLVTARKRGGFTQLDMVDAVGAGQSGVSALENGGTDPRLSTLQRYARACHLVLTATLNGSEALAGMAADLAPAHDFADPVVAEGLHRTASEGVGEVLRRLIQIENQPGVPLDSVLSSTRLSRSAAHRTTQSLASRGWLAFGDDQRLRLLPNAAAFIGVSIRPDHVRGLVTSLDPARDFDVHRLPLDDTSPLSVIERVAELVEHLLPQAGQPLGVGVELAGPVRGETGTVVFAPDLQPHTESSWENYTLEAELQQRLDGVKTVVANDAMALATREFLQHGDRGGLIVVTLSESTRGIGAGLVLQGRVITGTDGQAGEIGHLRVAGNRRICPRCGQERKGCLETIASGYAMATELGVADLAAASRLAERGDDTASIVFRRGGRALGRVIGDALTWLDAARIVIFGTRELAGGADVASARLFAEGVVTGLAKRSLTKTDYPQYVILEDWLGPQAAASVVVNDFLERPLDYSNGMVALRRFKSLTNAGLDRIPRQSNDRSAHTRSTNLTNAER